MNKLIRLSAIVMIGWILINGSLQSCSSPEPKDVKPNIILIMADDLGYGDLSCYGNPLVKTPHLDRLAAEGVRFTDFHSNGTVCSPTRAALLTGKYQQRTGISFVVTVAKRDLGLGLEETTFAESMKSEGYITGIFGKWHLGYDPRFNPVNQGFEEYIGFLAGNVDYHSHVDQAGYEDWWMGDQLVPEEGYTTDIITSHAVNFIKKHKEEKFLLYIPHEAPHYPYQGRLSSADRMIGGKPGKDYPVRGSEADYDAKHREMVEVMDEGVGKIIQTLKELELNKNTLVIFCSDNGATSDVGSNAPYRDSKGTVWEGGHRVPAIAWWPETIKPLEVNQEIVLSMDFFPTMVDLAGGSIPEDLDGVSLKGLFLKGESLPKRDLFWQYNSLRAIRSGEWKLVSLAPEEDPQLFNLKADPQETQDLSKTNPDLVQELEQKLADWEKDVNKRAKSSPE